MERVGIFSDAGVCFGMRCVKRGGRFKEGYFWCFNGVLFRVSVSGDGQVVRGGYGSARSRPTEEAEEEDRARKENGIPDQIGMNPRATHRNGEDTGGARASAAPSRCWTACLGCKSETRDT